MKNKQSIENKIFDIIKKIINNNAINKDSLLCFINLLISLLISNFGIITFQYFLQHNLFVILLNQGITVKRSFHYMLVYYS